MNRKISELNGIIHHIDPVDIYRIFHRNTKEYTFYSAVHGSFSKIGSFLVHKTNSENWGNSKYPIWSSSKRDKKNLYKLQKSMEVKQHTTRRWMGQERNEEIQTSLYLKYMKEKCKRNTPKLLGHIKSSPKKKIIALYAYIKKKESKKEHRWTTEWVTSKRLAKKNKSKPNPIDWKK